MKRYEFENLRIGDIVTPMVGRDKGKECQVVFIKDDEVVIECLDKFGFTMGGKCGSKLYVMKYRSIEYYL